MSCNAKKPTANEQEIYAALKLIELLYIKGEIPQRVVYICVVPAVQRQSADV